MKTLSLIFAAAALAFVSAECPNACSGHGTCGSNDACACYDNWMGGDCSQRVCPFGLSFVDTPLGDLNHDGEVDDATTVYTGKSNAQFNEQWSNTAVDDVAHYYSECSNKGVCNRASGECECYDGYTGSSCQRTACANDCSGHGQCYTLREIAAGDNRGAAREGRGRNYREMSFEYNTRVESGVVTSFDYNLWDADKNQACVCDMGYFGADCSQRECPRGDDPLTTKEKFCGGVACTAEIQAMNVAYEMGSAGTSTIQFEWTPTDDANGMVGALRSAKFDVKPGMTGDEYAELVQKALHTFPNNVLSGVAVTCANVEQDDDGNFAAAATEMECDVPADTNTKFYQVQLKVDFSNSVQGNLNPIYAKLWAVDGAVPLETPYAGATSAGLDIIQECTTVTTYHDVSGTATAVPMAYSAGVDVSYAAAINAAGEDKAAITAFGTIDADDVNMANGNREYAPCSNRGICDYSSGECQCFAGYTRQDCSVQAALAM